MKGDPMEPWLASARDDLASRAPDPMVETQLVARVRERGALRSVAAARPIDSGHTPGPWWTRLAFGLPVALAGVLAVLVVARALLPPAAPAPAGEAATPFIALVSNEALAADRAPVIVASQVARSALAEYGLPVDPARADEPVGAEFLMSRSGVVLAVRFRE